MFDLYGENGLKNDGVPDGNRGFLKETGEATFNSFFGTSEPFQAEEIENRFLSTNDTGRAPKPDCIKVECIQRQQKNYVMIVLHPQQILYLTLEELFSGCVRRVHVERRVLNSDGMSTRVERFPISVGVAPGTPSGTRLLFAGKGHQDVASTDRGDVEFEIEEIPHPKFRRQADTLVYSEKIYISEALAGKNVSIELLNGRKLSLPITTIVYPGFIQVVKGHGMPSGGGRHGDLHIHFDIEFPPSLSADVKGRLKTLLPVPHK